MYGVEVEDRGEVDSRGDPVGCCQLAKVASAVPCLHRQALHEAVSLVSLQARLHERQEQALAEVEAVARVEVLAHTLGVDDEAFHEPCEAVEHVVEGEERVGDDDALGG